jgi:DNA-binding response OmpR family regulator
MELPDGSGLDLLARWRDGGAGVRVIAMTAYSRDQYQDRVASLGAWHCVQKPLNLTDLATLVQRCLAGEEP